MKITKEIITETIQKFNLLCSGGSQLFLIHNTIYSERNESNRTFHSVIQTQVGITQRYRLAAVKASTWNYQERKNYNVHK